MRFAIVLLVLAGCAHAQLAGTPDYVCKSGPHGYGQDVCSIVERVHAAGVRTCPANKLEALEESWREIEIRIQHDLESDCMRPAHGCVWGNGALFADSPDAVYDETAHVVWRACFGFTGEDADGIYDPSFAAWLSSLR